MTDTDERIAALGLTTRSANCLTGAGIHTLPQLCASTVLDLLSIEALGVKSLREIQMRLTERGLKLSHPAPVKPKAPASTGQLPEWVNERNYRMIERFANGETLKVIGEAEGVSPARVRQVCSMVQRYLLKVADQAGLPRPALAEWELSGLRTYRQSWLPLIALGREKLSPAPTTPERTPQ